MVRQAVRDVRTAPPPPPADPPADPAVAALRSVVDDLAASSHAIGELMLEVAPAYLSDSEAADVLALLCEQIGEPLDHGLAARRYAMAGTVLYPLLPVVVVVLRSAVRRGSGAAQHLHGPGGTRVLLVQQAGALAQRRPAAVTARWQQAADRRAAACSRNLERSGSPAASGSAATPAGNGDGARPTGRAPSPWRGGSCGLSGQSQ
ncbi:hypothetical protein ADK56_02455 [Streptomyces sp. MMG1522]|nr:hypothetical protein ADK56_02455 [Streptomyces sp. MMG1522]